MSDTTYPDNHPTIRDNVITIAAPAGSTQYMPRSEWEKAAAERDEFRRVLALISAWRLDTGTRDPQLDTLLERVGESYDSARAMQSLIAWSRTELSTKGPEEVR
ncbi:hypothetical protein [uncultured Microbacterium sp.]|uniref:hypothetical protein n=1 Tax=uncultured Microbacterium sp. TaxID=191216 RepID=UPI00260491A4|nr:hypothetical protein [uncultured Microbacterium sp.]